MQRNERRFINGQDNDSKNLKIMINCGIQRDDVPQKRSVLVTRKHHIQFYELGVSLANAVFYKKHKKTSSLKSLFKRGLFYSFSFILDL